MARHPAGAVSIGRIYDPPASAGTRVLVDRLWPRGVKKDGAPMDLWLKEVAPSPDLRKWYGHRPERFDGFSQRYRRELEHGPQSEALEQLRDLRGSGGVVLLTATRDLELSGARVLMEVLAGRSAGE